LWYPWENEKRRKRKRKRFGSRKGLYFFTNCTVFFPNRVIGGVTTSRNKLRNTKKNPVLAIMM
jgi:hypothetical protein